MSEIDKLVYTTEIDSTGWARGLDLGETALDKFHANASSKLESLSISAPSIDLGSPAGSRMPDASGQADQLAALVLPLGSKIQSAIASATAPLLKFAATFGAQFQSISATIDAGAQRASSHMRFVETIHAIEHINALVKVQPSLWQKLIGVSSGFPLQLNKASRALSGGMFGAQLYGFITPTRRWGREIDQVGGKLRKLKAPILDFSSSTKSIFNIRNMTDAAASGAKNWGGQIAVALGFFGLAYKAVGFFSDGIKGASSLNETLSKTDAILGDASPAVKQFADEMAARFGLVNGQTLDAAASFAGLGKTLGKLSGNNLSDFSKQFTTLSADLSSFSNISFDEASRALSIGLSGNQSDTLKKLGVVMTEDTVKQYAYANGIARVGKELTEQQKLMARSGLIMQQLADVSGDLEKTQGGTANQWRKFAGTVANLGTSIGTILLPAVNAVVVVLNDFATAAYKAFEDNKETIAGWIDFFIDTIDIAAAIVTHLPAAFEVARLVIVEKLMQIGDYLAVLGPNAGIVADYIARNWKTLLLDAFNATLAGLQNLWTNFQAIGTAIGEWFANPTKGFQVNWTPILDGFKATVEEFPQLLKPVLTDMSGEIAEAGRPITDAIAEARRRRAAAIEAKPASERISPNSQASNMKPLQAEAKFSGALELGSDDAYSAIVKQLSGRGQGFENLEKINRENGSKQDTTNKLLAENLRRNNGRAMEWVG